MRAALATLARDRPRRRSGRAHLGGARPDGRARPGRRRRAHAAVGRLVAALGHRPAGRRRGGGPSDRRRSGSGRLGRWRAADWVADVDAAIAAACATSCGPATSCWSRHRGRPAWSGSALGAGPTAARTRRGARREDRPGRRARLAAVLDPVHAAGRAVLPQARLRPGDPQRRAADPPGQARHADDGRRRDHRVDDRRLLRRPPGHRLPGRARADRVRAAAAVPDGRARRASASSTTSSRSAASAASACGPGPRSAASCSSPSSSASSPCSFATRSA